MTMVRAALVVGMLVIVGCGGSKAPGGGTGTGGGGTGGSGTMSCDPSQAGCLQFSHSYGTQTVTPGQEIGSLCELWTLNNPDDIWVNAVELDNDGAYHHSNWFFIPNTDTSYQSTDGAFMCPNFDEVGTALAGGVLYAQSTQVKHEVQQFSPGVAVRIPPWSRIVGQTHLLNVTASPITTTLRMTVKAIPAAQVTTKLTPFQLVYHDLHIPAQSSAYFSGSCDFATATAMLNQPYSLKLYYVLPHYHKLGTGFQVAYYGGANDGTSIDMLNGYDGEAHGKNYDPPLDLSSNKGVTFGCGFTNPTTSEVGWGIGNQEMCEMLGFADSQFAYVGEVNDGAGMVTGMMGNTIMNSGPCTVTALGWSQMKSGGMPPM
jgi:hypothetical protein